MRLTPGWKIGILAAMLVMPFAKSISQCSPDTGTGPLASYFNTGQAAPGLNDPGGWLRETLSLQTSTLL